MPAVIVPNTVLVHFRWLSAGQLCENVYAYNYTAIPTVATLTSLCNEVIAAFTPKYKLFQNGTVTYTEVRADDIGATGRATATVAQPPGTVGARAGNALPDNVALSAVGYTGKRGRSFRARKSFTGFQTGDQSADNLLTPLIALVTDLLVQWLISRVSNAFKPAVASQTANVSTPLTSAAILNPYIDSQKTRLTNHGN